MPNTRTRFLTWPKVQKGGVDTVLEPDILNFVGDGIEITISETPSRTAKITIAPTTLFTSDVGTVKTSNGNTQPRFYLWGIDQEMISTSSANAALSANQTLAMPWLVKRTFTADYLVFKKNTNNNGLNYKAAIYTSPLLTSAYPSELVEASGELVSGSDSLAGHYKWTFAAPIQFTRGTLYWLHLKRPTGTDTGTFAGSSVYQQILGFDMVTTYNGIQGLNGYASAVGGTPYDDAFPDPATSEMTAGSYQLFLVGVHVTSIP